MPSPMSGVRAQLRAILSELLHALEIIDSAPAGISRPIPAASQNSGGAKLRAVERAILEAASDAPLTSRALARRAGYKFNSYFRQALADLIEAQRIERRGNGYVRYP